MLLVSRYNYILTLLRMLLTWQGCRWPWVLGMLLELDNHEAERNFS
jgi:hypothetical protein